MWKSQRWAIDYFFAPGIAPAYHFLILIVVVHITLYYLLNPWVLLPLLLLQSLCCAAFFYTRSTYVYRRPKTDASLARLAVIHNTFMLIAAATWSAALIIVLEVAYQFSLVAAVITACGALVIVSSHFPFPSVTKMVIWIMTSAYSLGLLWHEPVENWLTLLLLTCLFGLALNGLIDRLFNNTYQNIQLSEQLQQHVQRLEQTSQALDEANKNKSSLLAQASHDLRQPLHAIHLLSESLLPQIKAPEQHSVVHDIHKASHSLNELFQSLMDLSALESGHVQPQYTHFDLNDVFDELNVHLQTFALANDVTLRFKHTALSVYTDKNLLRLILQNLVQNAIKYAPGSDVLVGARRGAKQQLRIEVHDTGSGIPEAQRERLFDAFTRGDTGKTTGLGLGLAIVQRLSGLLSLSTTVRSSSRGSVFTVHGLPYQTMNVKQPIVAAQTYQSFDGVRVAVVDDDQQVRDSMAHLLTTWGCEVQVYEAVSNVQALSEYDFLVLDQSLQNQLGTDLLQQMLDQNLAVPAGLLITAEPLSSITLPKGLSRVHVLSKPAPIAKIRSALLTYQLNQYQPVK